MNSQNKNPNVIRSIFIGIGFAILYLLIGTVLDYLITQGLSQFLLADCSEDCYFRIFNILFVVVVILSAVGGLRAGVRDYNR